MIQTYPNEGLLQLIQRVVVGGVTWRLFTNNLTVSPSTVLADLTEAAFAGYAPVAQVWADFALTGVGNDGGFAIAAPIGFLNSTGSPQTICGYYVTDSGNTMLLAIAKFDGAPESLAAGATKLVTPIVGDFSA